MSLGNPWDDVLEMIGEEEEKDSVDPHRDDGSDEEGSYASHDFDDKWQRHCQGDHSFCYHAGHGTN